MKTKIIFMLVAIFAMYSQSAFHKKESVRTEKNSSYAMQPSGESPTA